ncbi:hypothetical protein J421_4097 [Gemmatirosa kalamazoonensis]|uniref:Carboxypeptidase regulatory-like domain-containing protein n=1 Tax=Gemmatirosa kalamazoonensis TaxID=861299 RepID=W0RKL9_9BACT|nr:hypothetical protein J421_4097 [Gemmatirosa kalamazoonensis]
MDQSFAGTERAVTDYRRGATSGPTSFILQGRLEGLLGPDFPEPLAGARVRLYRPTDVPEVTAARAAALPKDTLAVLTDEQVAAKAGNLLAEGLLDEDGRFAITISADRGYGGAAFEIDVYCGTVPHLPPRPRPHGPVQFALTTLQPRWRVREETAIAAFDYTVPARFWCGIRTLFGGWTVYGTVSAGALNTPVPNVRVRAFDVDWLQNDALGSDLTNGAGRYRIDYATDDFTPTIFPFLQIEFVSGPDLYFRVETAGGTALLTEPPSRGRAADRENVGHCKRVDLHLDDAPTDGGDLDQQPITSFFQVGRYQATTGIDSDPLTGNGRTLHVNPALADRAFFATLPLRGVLGQHMPFTTDPLEYRFEFAEYALGSTNEAALSFAPVPIAAIGETQIGVIQLFDPSALDPDDILTELRVLVNGPPGPPPPNADYVNADIVGGWIRVPQNNNINKASGGLFVANTGLLANVASTALATFETIDCSALQAGDAAQSEGRTVPREHFFAIRMRVRRWAVAPSEIAAGRVRRMAISNPTYTNITRHPEWSPTPAFSDIAVTVVDLAELSGGAGCTPINATLTPQFTAAHPNLGAVSMWVEGGPTPAKPLNVPNPSPDDRFGTATPNGWVLTDLAPCSYLVQLFAEVRVTTGEAEPSDRHDYIGFCR